MQENRTHVIKLTTSIFSAREKSGKLSLVCAITEPTLIASSVVRVVTLTIAQEYVAILFQNQLLNWDEKKKKMIVW